MTTLDDSDFWMSELRKIGFRRLYFRMNLSRACVVAGFMVLQSSALFAQQDATNIGTKLVGDPAIDKVGNVLGDRPGTQPKPHLVFSAHLDTVFPEGTDARMRSTRVSIRRIHSRDRSARC
jgi:hypothetical protein